MRIYSMTATFGKLEHETLTLQPGLNIITAHNEWGKSTWCAFLVAMLYGLDTRAKSTKGNLADKERYAPWSGSPMAGRIDLNWNGRDITIERKTRGRIPLGDFRAYETKSGLEIPELTAANCGPVLLGVERSVFVRSGFVRLADMSVTDDEALRRRLNNLVTTGDENGAADRLAKGLKELKNRVRYNRTGLLPQAEAERERMEHAIRELEELENQCQKVSQRLDEVEDWRMALENHKTALAYAASEENEKRVQQAAIARDEAQSRLEEASALCDELPGRETAEELLAEIDRLGTVGIQLHTQLQELSQAEMVVEDTELFRGLSGENAISTTNRDWNRHGILSEEKNWLFLFGAVAAVLGLAVVWWYRLLGLIALGAGIILIISGLVLRYLHRREMRQLEAHYGTTDTDRWLRMAEEYASQLYRQARMEEDNLRNRRSIERQMEELQTSIQEATQGLGLVRCRQDWESVLSAWEDYDDALQEYSRTQEHYGALRAMAKTAPKPEFPDRLEYSEEETSRMLSDCASERHRLENRLGQYQGRMAAMGSRTGLEEKLTRINARIAQLEETYTALTLAQETLAEASAQLQRRFAPRISKRAQELMAKMTGGRYDRLSLGEDLSLRAGAEREDTLQSILWRSDGTVDQLYLSLRLAVAEELTPDAPLVLDDALVRFDDTRLKAALEILKEESQHKQVILFSCQSREKNMI